MRFKIFSLVSFIMIVFLLSCSSAYAQNPEDLPDMAENQPQISKQIRLLIDGAEANPVNLPFQLTSGHMVISLPALQNIIPCQSEWGAAGEIFILWEDKRVQLFPGINEILVNSVPLALDLAPFAGDDGILLLPLRAIAEALGYQVIYDEANQTILLNSPGYQPLPPVTPIPNQAAVTIDYSSLPTWGSILSIPELVELWKDEQIITGYFTRLVNSPAGRTTNIVISSAKINGVILQPGETFSFNRIVGPRTVQTGYQNAKIFVGKKVITGIGGGVCQTSSTLYNLALEAGMQILERYPHSLKVVYAPPKRDATVSWGGADFKFRNNKDFPVKILCKVDNGFVFALMVKPESLNDAAPLPSQ